MCLTTLDTGGPHPPRRGQFYYRPRPHANRLPDVKIDLEELFTGLDQQVQTEQDSPVAVDFDTKRALVQMRVGLVRLTAPGLKLQLKGLTVVLHHPDANYPPEAGKPVTEVPDLPPLEDEEQAAKHKPTRHSAEHQAKSASEPPSPTPTAEGAGAEADAEADVDKLAALSGTPGFAANVLSEWILKDVTIELKGFTAKGKVAPDCHPYMFQPIRSSFAGSSCLSQGT